MQLHALCVWAKFKEVHGVPVILFLSALLPLCSTILALKLTVWARLDSKLLGYTCLSPPALRLQAQAHVSMPGLCRCWGFRLGSS